MYPHRRLDLGWPTLAIASPRVNDHRQYPAQTRQFAALALAGLGGARARGAGPQTLQFAARQIGMRASAGPAVVFFYERPRSLKAVQHTRPVRVRWELFEVSRRARPDASMAASSAAPRLAAAFMTSRMAASMRGVADALGHVRAEAHPKR